MQQKLQDSVNVCIRLKPEQEDKINVQYTQSSLTLEKNSFTFDHVFPPNANQAEVFETIGTKLINYFLYGFNGCFFVYGQSGSGKTYTMIGEGQGIIQRAFHELFQRMEQMGYFPSSTISCSYYEIYNEQIIDLLDCRKDKRLNMRQDVKKGVFVENLFQESVNSFHKLSQCLSVGLKNRHVGESGMIGQPSSRSHSVFTVTLERKIDNNGFQVSKTSKLYFIDLVGYEGKKVWVGGGKVVGGERMKEIGHINKSLSALRMMINALGRNENHIPFHDSKLTVLLKDILDSGGSTKICMIGTIMMRRCSLKETLQTLNFANNVKLVKLRMGVNVGRIKIEKNSLNRSVKMEKSIEVKKEDEIRWEHQLREISRRMTQICQFMEKSSRQSAVEDLHDWIQNHQMRNWSNSTPGQPVDCMIDENQSRRDNQLLTECICENNAIYEQMASKLQEYKELRARVRNLVLNEQLAMGKGKHLEKWQYESLIEKKDAQINELCEKVRELQNVIEQQDMKIGSFNEEMKKSKRMMEGNAERYESRIGELKREVLVMRNGLKENEEVGNHKTKKGADMEVEGRQYRQLYLSISQLYQTAKASKIHVQQSLANKCQQLSQLDEKCHQQKCHYQQKLDEEKKMRAQLSEFYKNALAEMQRQSQNEEVRRKDSESKTESLVKNYSVERRQRLIAEEKLKIVEKEFQQKLIQEKNIKMQAQQASKNIELQLKTKIKSQQNRNKDSEIRICELAKNIEVFRKDKTKLQEKLKILEDKLTSCTAEYEQYQRRISTQRRNDGQKIYVLMHQLKNMKGKIEENGWKESKNIHQLAEQMMREDNDKQEIMAEWQNDLRRSQHGHYWQIGECDNQSIDKQFTLAFKNQPGQLNPCQLSQLIQQLHKSLHLTLSSLSHSHIAIINASAASIKKIASELALQNLGMKNRYENRLIEMQVEGRQFCQVIRELEGKKQQQDGEIRNLMESLNVNNKRRAEQLSYYKQSELQIKNLSQQNILLNKQVQKWQKERDRNMSLVIEWRRNKEKIEAMKRNYGQPRKFCKLDNERGKENYPE